MSWVEPKTNWNGDYDHTGKYIGDKFSATDYNRISNNIKYLYDKSLFLYNKYEVAPTGVKSFASYLFAEDINNLQNVLETIDINSVNVIDRPFPTYVANGRTMTYEELNFLESAILDIYYRLESEYEGRNKFTFLLGERGGF